MARSQYLAEYRAASKVRLAGLIFAEIEMTELVKGHPVKPYAINHNLNTLLWCGPAVVSAITGADTELIRELIRAHRKNRKSVVTGTRAEDLEFALHKLGYAMRLFYMCHGELLDHLTMAKWLKTYKRKAGVAYVIELCGTKREPDGHWAVVLGGYYCCSHIEKWVPIEQAPNRRVRVATVYTVKKRRP